MATRTNIRRGATKNLRSKASVPVAVYAPGTRPSTGVGSTKVVGTMTKAQMARVEQKRSKQIKGGVVKNAKRSLGSYI